MEFLIVFLVILLAYFLGSIPTGFLFGKYLQGIDIRECGSGSTGATNVLRTLGKIPAIAVLIIDLLKGVFAVAVVRIIYSVYPVAVLPSNWQYWLMITVALTAVIGHSKSVWLSFTGGKSVATSLGVLFVINPLVAIGSLTVFGIMLAISKIVSLSSIVAAIAVAILMIVLQQPLPYLIFGGLISIYVIARHRSNIERLLAGTEPKIGQKLSNSET